MCIDVVLRLRLVEAFVLPGIPSAHSKSIRLLLGAGSVPWQPRLLSGPLRQIALARSRRDGWVRGPSG